MNLSFLKRRFAESLTLYNLLAKEGLHELPAEYRTNPSFSRERSILQEAGLPDDTLDRLEVLAERWGVSLREAALALGAVTANDYVNSAVHVHGVEVIDIERAAELAPISPSPEPSRLLESASPVVSHLSRDDFMLNAEGCDPETIADIAAALGPKRTRVIRPDFKPSRAAPQAILIGEPPIYLLSAPYPRAARRSVPDRD